MFFKTQYLQVNKLSDKRLEKSPKTDIGGNSAAADPGLGGVRLVQMMSDDFRVLFGLQKTEVSNPAVGAGSILGVILPSSRIIESPLT